MKPQKKKKSLVGYYRKYDGGSYDWWELFRYRKNLLNVGTIYTPEINKNAEGNHTKIRITIEEI